MRRDTDEWKSIRQDVLVNGLSKRAACEKYKLGWHTLNKILLHSEPPGYRQKEPRPKRVLAAALPIIHEILEADQKAPKKQRHTAKRIFERLRAEHGFAGSKTVVEDSVRAWRQTQQAVLLGSQPVCVSRGARSRAHSIAVFRIMDHLVNRKASAREKRPQRRWPIRGRYGGVRKWLTPTCGMCQAVNKQRVAGDVGSSQLKQVLVVCEKNYLRASRQFSKGLERCTCAGIVEHDQYIVHDEWKTSPGSDGRFQYRQSKCQIHLVTRAFTHAVHVYQLATAGTNSDYHCIAFIVEFRPQPGE